MLSMKTLKVAIVTMGSALLLGPGLAVAQGNTIQLDGTMAAAPTPLVYAQETLPAMADPMGRRALELENDMDVAVLPRRAIGMNEELYIRVDLAMPVAISLKQRLDGRAVTYIVDVGKSEPPTGM